MRYTLPTKLNNLECVLQTMGRLVRFRSHSLPGGDWRVTRYFSLMQRTKRATEIRTPIDRGESRCYTSNERPSPTRTMQDFANQISRPTSRNTRSSQSIDIYSMIIDKQGSSLFSRYGANRLATFANPASLSYMPRCGGVDL